MSSKSMSEYESRSGSEGVCARALDPILTHELSASSLTPRPARAYSGAAAMVKTEPTSQPAEMLQRCEIHPSAG